LKTRKEKNKFIHQPKVLGTNNKEKRKKMEEKERSLSRSSVGSS